jgi:hypothetical protein
MESKGNRYFRKDERAYTLNSEDLPVYVGQCLGDLEYKDAIELSVIRRTARGLPAALEYISLITPSPGKLKRGGKSPHTPRASKNNPYICDHCGYRSTRYDNMIKHLDRVHDDRVSDPRAKSRAI